MVNKVIFIGRLGKNAEVKTAQNNKEYVVSVWPMVLRPPYKTFRRLFDGFLRAAIQRTLLSERKWRRGRTRSHLSHW